MEKPRVFQRVGSANSEFWSELQHLLQQVDTKRVKLRHCMGQVLCWPSLDVHSWFPLRQHGNPRPSTLRGCTQKAEDALELVLVGGSGEQRASAKHLSHDTTDRPNVDAGAVGSATKQHVGGAVP